MNSEARLRTRTAARALAAPFAVLLLASCSGPSSYHNSANPPQAIAHAIGAATTSAAGVDPVAITVRAQSQVTLTGNASSGGDAAIGSFVWSQTDAAPLPQVVLLYLDSDTVTFTAPKVGADTTLHFTLTVTTAGNAAATAHVTVLVKAVNDPNQFLALLPTLGAPSTTVQHHFKVAIDTVEGLSAPLAADTPVCVTVARTIKYVTRSRAAGTVTLPALTADSSWAASIGGAPNDFSSYTNPKVTFEIPALNQDDINVLYNNPGAIANLSQQIVPADIDKAQLSLTASASPGPCAATAKTTLLAGKTLQVLVQDEGGNAVGSPGASATFTPDQLVSQQANTPYETAETARAYYAAIDPAGTKTTLNAWLTANCFDPTQSGYGADAHATYTNNYDLGFGRDMYFTTCKAGSSHVGDMASVVINYASLEAAASKLNPVIAVAMEYSAAAGAAVGSRRFPKFYVFAPDDRDGNLYRISSADFDHRGEKYLPGACIMCHGGSVPQPATANFVHGSPTDYPTIVDPTNSANQLGLGDVDATFLPWDLDSFLYTSAPSTANVDTSFLGLSVPPSGYTRSTQEPNLKKLNQLAYCTYQPELEKAGTATVDRFNALRALVGRWYGGSPGADKITYPTDSSCAGGGAPTPALLPNATYDDADSTPAGWAAPQTAAQQQPGVTPTLTSDMIYHRAYARHCRSCHTANAVIADQFTDYPTFMKQFVSTKQQVNPPAVPGNGLQYALMQGRMPLARLTMDRFWVDFSGGDSAAKILATHIEQVNGETDLIAPATCDLTSPAACDAVAPGVPIANLNVTVPATAPFLRAQSISLPSYAADAAMTITAPMNRFGGVLGDASKSFFIQNYGWTLCLVPTSGGSCVPQDVVGSQSADPGFSNYAPGTYELTLAADNGLAATPATTKYVFTVPQKDPSLATCPTPTPTVSLGNGGSVSQDYSCITSGDEPNANTPNVFEILDPTAADPTLPSAWKTSLSTAAWTASTNSSSTLAGSKYVFGYALNFMFSNAATQDATLQYRVRDVDGGTVGTTPPGMITFHLTDTLTAGGISLVVGPAANYTIAGSSLNNNIVPSAAVATVTMIVDSTNFYPLGGSLTSNTVPANGSFVFTPPMLGTPPHAYVNVDCDYLGNKISQPLPIITPVACQPDTFQFHLLAADNVTKSSNEGQVTVQINAQTSFSREGSPKSVFSQLGLNCSASCHGDSTNTLAQGAWVYNGADFDATYQSLKHLVTIKGNANGSTFYLAPCFTHEPPMNFNMNSTECQTILNWINEGAYED